MQLRPTLCLCLALATVYGAGCSKQQIASPTHGSAEMARELAAIADTLDPNANPWANEQRLAYFSSLPVPSDPVERLKLQGAVAREFLYSGRSELAANAFERMIENVRQFPQLAPDDYIRTLTFLKAVAYLRMGEQRNCIDNHSGAVCILPIQPEAVHKAREGSEGAIETLTRILEESPDNLEARWLLNIAYSTLGLHPDGVPERFLITTDKLAGPPSDFPTFHNVAHEVGLATSSLSGGSITEDFDGDLDLDVVTSSWGLRDSLRFFENTGDGHFVERSHAAGFDGLTGGLNINHADFDNDGDFDILVLRGAWMGEAGQIPNSLLRNNGNGTFEDVTVAAGLYSRHPTQAGAWADYDNDGWLDLFIGNESSQDRQYPSELYHNNGDGTFTEVGAEAGAAVVGYVKAAAWIDFDNDGDQDLYVSLLGEPNRLLENRSGTFTDVGDRAGVGMPYQSFPTWAWDYDNDGWMDLLALSYQASLKEYAYFELQGKINVATPHLYHNNGDGTFADVTDAAGLAVPLKAMGSNFGDLDNDGWLDFYAGTGDPDLRTLVPNKMYHNVRGRFVDVTAPGGFGHIQKGHGVSFADLDNDGDEDVHAVMGGALSGDIFQNVLFENPGGENGSISLRLIGRTSNTNAIGARIEVQITDSMGRTHSIFRSVTSGGSFGSSSYRQSIGLGSDAASVSARIQWPSGTEQSFENLRPGSFYVVDEADGLKEIHPHRFEFARHR